MRRSANRNPAGAILYRTDFDKHVLLANFAQRGWQRARGEDDDEWSWDIYWASVHSIRQIFNPDGGRRLEEHQVVSHFPNHYELTRKDLMARNIKKYRKEREKLQRAPVPAEPPASSAPEGAQRASACERSVEDLPPEWVPTTFMLPNDYALFVEEFRRQPNVTWIAKPTGKAQGRGIFIVSRLQQLKKWAGGNQKAPFSNQPALFREPYIISRYIHDPLLIGSKKFDMRLYVLVTSYRPLRVYLYRSGFCRFCAERYSSDVAEFDNVFVHLTNVAIQKHGEEYNDNHGGKWDIDNLMLFIEGTHGYAAREKLMADMEHIIIHSLKAVQNVMINDRHCFEMYGFDILIDAGLRPWLLEVNASPSLNATTNEDRLLKLRLIHDVLNIVMPPIQPVDMEEEVVGGFRPIYEEGGPQRGGREDAQKGCDRRRPQSRAGNWR